MATDNVDHLHHLVEINLDAEAGFRTAAANVNNSEIETLLSGYAKQHARFAEELQAELQREGERTPDSGTIGGAVHRGWIGMKAALSGHSATSMMTVCESGEESAEVAYEDAADVIRTGQAHTLIEKQREQIREFRAHLQRLIGEAKDGVEFQANQ